MDEVSLVSAVVVNRDGHPHLADCLDSLFAQTWPRLEVILVDNASTDAALDEAEHRIALAYFSLTFARTFELRDEGFMHYYSDAARAPVGRRGLAISEGHRRGAKEI